MEKLVAENKILAEQNTKLSEQNTRLEIENLRLSKRLQELEETNGSFGEIMQFLRSDNSIYSDNKSHIELGNLK